MSKRQHITAHLIEIYEMYRTAALNKAYYGRMLARHQRGNMWLEIAIAIGATGSGVSGLAVLNDVPNGKIVWATITSVSGLLAIAKPILQLNKQVERYSRLFTGHTENYMALRSIVTKVRRRRSLTPELVQEFETAEQRFVELSRDDDPNTNKKIHRLCEKEVREAYPENMLWYPEDAPKRPTKMAPPMLTVAS